MRRVEIRTPEHADMELVDDQLVERRRPPAPIVPRISVRGADEAGAVREGRVRAELTRIRVALEALAAALGADDPEQVGVSIGHAGREPGPGAIAEGRAQGLIARRPARPVGTCAMVGDEMDRARGRRPGTEGRAARNERRAHRRVSADDGFRQAHLRLLDATEPIPDGRSVWRDGAVARDRVGASAPAAGAAPGAGRRACRTARPATAPRSRSTPPATPAAARGRAAARRRSSACRG